jgi:hypothetical protein
MLESELAKLFLQTGKDHHQAFIAEWPAVYAQFFINRFGTSATQ